MSYKFRIIFFMFMMLCILSPSKGFTDTYKWTDTDGTLHFSDNPTNVSSGSGMAITQEDNSSSQSGDAQSATTGENKPAKSKQKHANKQRKSQNTGSKETSRPVDVSKCLNTFYSMVTTELNKAYNDQGRPKVNFDNLAKVKDLGLSRLEANVSQWPKRATFSISVLDDYISVYVFCGSEQNYGGNWHP